MFHLTCRTAMAFALVCALGVGSAEARPISYVGGTMLMLENDSSRRAADLSYTFSRDMSAGVLSEYWREDDWWFNGVQGNYLLNRWNMPNAQANMYVVGGAGVAHSNAGAFDNKNEPAGFIGFMADAEDRRFYVSYKNRYTNAGEIADFFDQSARVGVAPYIGDYGDIHTWLMFQVDHRPWSQDQYVATPLVRFFWRDYLAEVGWGDDDQFLFNLTVTY